MSVDRRALDELLELPLRPAVSILMPAHRGGPATRQGPIRLKNLAREAERQLELRGLVSDDAARLLAPVLSLVDDRGFWRHQAGGLAVYAAPNFFRHLTASRELREAVTVSDHFHVTQLLPVLSLDRRFYVLALSQKDVRLMEATSTSAHEVDLGDLPRSLSTALRYDTPERQLQPHVGTAVGGKRSLVFHGHGAPLADHKEAILQFFHQLDRGLRPLFADHSTPLVLAAVDYLVPLYREANTHPALLAEAIPGNPDELSAQTLATRAWELVKPHLEAELEAVVDRFRDLTGIGRASSELATVLGASHAGRVGELIVADGVERWGTFEPHTGVMTVRDGPGPVGEDLVNLAAVWTLERRGAVHVVERARVPGGAEIAAIFRY